MTTLNANYASVLVLLLLWSSTALLRAQELGDVDTAVQRTLSEFHVPGIAVGVISHGKVVLAKGYGVLREGETKPVTSHTLFQIASNTKAFTSASLAILVDDKKIGWDDRVVDVLPEFQMADPFVTREMRIRDLLCHRSGLGLGAGDLLSFPDARLSTSEFVRRLRYVPLATSFRSAYAYDNVLYTVAGQVIERVSGKSWGDFVKERIFTPVKMSGSRVRSSEVLAADEVAVPHVPVDATLRTASLAALGPNEPAGAILSSIDDLMKWVGLQLSTGGSLFSARQSAEMWTPHIFMPIPAEYPKPIETLRPHWLAYGLGWMLRDYQGHRIVTHDGGLNGMVTRVLMLPEEQLGLVILTNQQAGFALSSITQTLIDHYLGTPGKDWVTAYAGLAKVREQDAKRTVAEAAAHRASGSKPSLPPAGYAGVYRDAWYGDVTVSESSGKLAMQFSHSPTLNGTLEHFQYDTFIARWKDRSLDADAYVTFALNADGTIRDLRMAAISPSTDFSFDFQDLELKRVRQ